MGGNLFKLGRLPRADYKQIETELKVYLDQKFGQHYRIPRYYANKPDFGDLDIVVSSAGIANNWDHMQKEIVQDLGISRYKSAGAVFSTVYKNFQVDFFVRNHQYFETTYNFLSFNDIGNLIGRIFKRFNLKYGEQGLQYVFRRADHHYQKDIEVSKDAAKIMGFLELDFAHWQRGFASKAEMFDWVVACPYFSVKPYIEMSNKMEKRAKERPTIQAFLEYLEAQHIDKTYDFDEKDAYLSVIEAYFPEADLLAHIANEKEREKYVLAIKAKYNGRLIMELFPTLKGKALGDFMKAFQAQWQDYEKALYAMTPEEIVDHLKAFYT
ncbi:hypothetical protein [Microscilla marina]|uniref:Uncharacterized protein n=1 Tax=Microscilla marina ATCC 23134 TaxID=313606 RepID=A1ZJ24_MICM2|nr:hypothetical protein [Microscilla marina]EAY29560.1 hypothetical protein M23134_00444 [Microscilla marina ATCC 23134]